MYIARHHPQWPDATSADHIFRHLVLTVLCVLLVNILSTACSRPPAMAAENLSPLSTPTLNDPASEIHKLLASHTESETFTGAVLVARNGEILLSQGYGWADQENQTSNTPQTKYRLGSVTKQFTAAAIMILVSQGKVEVQDRICPHLSECPDAWQQITIHHLLTHTSGITNLTELPNFKDFKSTPTTPEQTIARFKDKPLDFQPGKRWNYSNSGYVLLGYLIERISGESYEMFLQQNIFDPLQMTSTGYDHNDDSLATGYSGVGSQWDKPDYIDMTLPFAAGGLYSSIEDLYRWNLALYAGQLLPEEYVARMIAPYAMTRFPGLSYGYGLFVGKMNDRLAMSHGGGIDGFITEIRHYTADDVTIIILSNRQTTNVPQIADQIGRVMFQQ